MGVMTPPHHAVVSWFDSIFSVLGLWGFGFAGLVLASLAALITLTAQNVLLNGLYRRKRRISGNERREPPLLAESLLCIFARTKDIEALMGDFEERFARDCASGMSQRRAVFRYWSQVLRSIGPQMWQAIKRVGLLGLIAAALRR